MFKTEKYLLFILSIVALSNNAQNLVPNYSFETYSTLPYSGSQISFASPWKGVTTNSSDYFYDCSSGAGVPSNGCWQFPRTGCAYAAIWVINAFGGENEMSKL